MDQLKPYPHLELGTAAVHKLQRLFEHPSRLVSPSESKRRPSRVEASASAHRRIGALDCPREHGCLGRVADCDQLVRSLKAQLVRRIPGRTRGYESEMTGAVSGARGGGGRLQGSSVREVRLPRS